MKKLTLLFAVMLLLSSAVLPAMDDIKVGRIYVPKAFVHNGQDYAKGVYLMTLTEKDGVPTFVIKSKKGEQLFEEMAVIKAFEGKNKNFKYRVKKEMLKGYEYFRVKVATPENLYMAYFLVKK